MTRRRQKMISGTCKYLGLTKPLEAAGSPNVFHGILLPTGTKPPKYWRIVWWGSVVCWPPVVGPRTVIVRSIVWDKQSCRPEACDLTCWHSIVVAMMSAARVVVVAAAAVVAVVSEVTPQALCAPNLVELAVVACVADVTHLCLTLVSSYLYTSSLLLRYTDSGPWQTMLNIYCRGGETWCNHFQLLVDGKTLRNRVERIEMVVKCGEIRGRLQFQPIPSCRIAEGVKHDLTTSDC